MHPIIQKSIFLKRTKIAFFVFIFGLASPTFFARELRAGTITWSEAIENVERLARQHYDAYVKKTGFLNIGTAWNNADIDMHRCAILGRMLGYKDRISQFEPPYLSVDSTETDHDYEAASLWNWVTQAQFLRRLPKYVKAKIWNLECAFQDGLSDTAIDLKTVNDAGEIFEVSDDSEWLYVVGPIEAGFYDRFASELMNNPQVKYISLGSPGGAVYDAMRAGMLIRQKGLTTSLYADCYSACPLVFMGGKTRAIWSAADDKMGFHEVSSQGNAIPHGDDTYVALYKYMQALGVNPELVLMWMWSAAPSEISIKDSQDLCDARVATFVYHGCVAE